MAWWRWDAGAGEFRLFSEPVYVPPNIGSTKNLAVIGDSTVFQGGPGPGNLRNMLVSRGWTADRVYIYAVSGKAMSAADENGKTGAQSVADARAYFATRGGEPDWLINLGANNAGSSDATNTTQLNNLLANLTQFGAKVYFTGLSQSDTLDSTSTANRVRFNRLSRTIVDRRPNCQWYDWHRIIKGYVDTAQNWNADGVHQGTAGYVIKNTFFCDSVGRPSDLPPLNVRLEGAGFQTYESLYSINDTLQQVVNKVTPGNVLTLPEGTFEMVDFSSAAGTNGLRLGTDTSGTVCRGIAGSGDNTILRMQANSSTKTPGASLNSLCLIHIWKQRQAMFANFTLEGTEQGHDYNALRFSYCPSPTMFGVKEYGAHPGSMNYPPGETFGINVYMSDNAYVYDCEFDGRFRSTGARESASALGWNTASNAAVRNVYAHHGKTGMPTWWETTNIHTVDLVTDRNGSGSGALNGQGINHEKVGGVIRHIRPNLTIARSEGNTGLHFSLNNSIGAAGSPPFGDATDVQLLDVIHDPGPTGGCFGVQILAGYHPPQGQTQVTSPMIVKNGVTLTPRKASEGTGSPNPATQYFIYN